MSQRSRVTPVWHVPEAAPALSRQYQFERQVAGVRAGPPGAAR